MFGLIRRGKVLSVMVGGSRRVPYDSLRAYVDQLITEQARLGSEPAISEAPGIGTSAPANGGHRAVATA